MLVQPPEPYGQQPNASWSQNNLASQQGSQWQQQSPWQQQSFGRQSSTWRQGSTMFGAEERCIYYDRDGRRVRLSPEDLAWAKENGLIVDKQCY